MKARQRVTVAMKALGTSALVLLLVVMAGMAAGAGAAGAAGANAAPRDVRAAFRRVLTAPEARARMTIERSDPFGGSPSREQGRLWLIPGRGLRYRSAEKDGQELVIDRNRESFLLYSRSEERIYRAPYARAPLRLRRLIADPDGALGAGADKGAVPERRRVGGSLQSGYRIGSGSLGDSLPDVSVWMSSDARSNLPRWVVIASETDTVSVEFRDWQLARQARPADLVLSAPAGTPESPLDPRELLNRGGTGETR
jgi:hypothetical protein